MRVENYDKKSPLKGALAEKMKKLTFLESAMNFSPRLKDMNNDLAQDC